MKYKTISSFALTLSLGAILSVMPTSEAYAAGESADCAIWICMPAGFPSGCSSAYKAFIKRVTRFPKPRPPLPPLMSCTSGKTQGSYAMGYERHEPCKEGFTTHDRWDDDRGFSRYQTSWNSPVTRQCVNYSNCYETGGGDDRQRICETYSARPRQSPHYVDLTIDGTDYGRYWYNR